MALCELSTQRLLDAAVEGFAEFGAAGARVDRIAKRAGISKERLYGYFGDKEALFVQVLRQELARLAAAVPLSDEQARDLGEYAGRVLEHHRQHPALPRLLYWEGLERGGAAELLYAVIALAGWWAAAPQVTRMLAVASTKRRGRGDATILSEAAVVTLVRRMSAAD